MDFMRKYNCILEYSSERDLMIVRSYDIDHDIGIPLRNGPTINSISLPARCEVIRSIPFESSEEEVLIPYQTIQDGVYIANTITSKSDPLIKIINTTEKDLIISDIKLVTETLKNYKIADLNCTQTKSKEKMERLSKNFPTFVEKELKALCHEFSDIFALESEKISSNNFYKQKLKVSSTQPVYIKNYRIPQSQKEEINKQVDKLIKDDIV